MGVGFIAGINQGKGPFFILTTNEVRGQSGIPHRSMKRHGQERAPHLCPLVIVGPIYITPLQLASYLDADLPGKLQHVVLLGTTDVVVMDARSGDEVRETPSVAAGTQMPLAGVSADIVKRLEIIGQDLDPRIHLDLVGDGAFLVVGDHAGGMGVQSCENGRPGRRTHGCGAIGAIEIGGTLHQPLEMRRLNGNSSNARHGICTLLIADDQHDVRSFTRRGHVVRL